VPLIKQRTRNWPDEARRFVINLSQKLDADSDDIVMQDLRIDDDVDADIDPDVLNESQGSINTIQSSIEGEITKFTTINKNMWKAAIKTLEKNDQEVNATSSLRSFYALYRKDFPRMARVAEFLCAMTASASEIERSFAASSAQVRDPQKNRTRASKIELTLQLKGAKRFKKLHEKIMEKERK